MYICYRGLVIGLMCPILQRIGYGMTWQDGLVLTWSGLRGAVGLTLALLVWEDPHLNQDTVRHKVSVQIPVTSRADIVRHQVDGANIEQQVGGMYICQTSNILCFH